MLADDVGRVVTRVVLAVLLLLGGRSLILLLLVGADDICDDVMDTGRTEFDLGRVVVEEVGFVVVDDVLIGLGRRVLDCKLAIGLNDDPFAPLVD